MINIWGFLLTLLLYLITMKLKKIRAFTKIPTMVLTGLTLMVFFIIFKVDYNNYNSSACIFTMLLGPATIALACPLYENASVLSKNKRAVYLGFLVATITALFTTLIVGKLLNTDWQIIASLFPKTVTNPIAVEISKTIGGIPELTACLVVMSGVFGAFLGHKILKFFKIKSDIAIGIAIGACSHVLGTSICLEKKRKKQVVMSTLSLIVIGILTTIFCICFIK